MTTKELFMKINLLRTLTFTALLSLSSLSAFAAPGAGELSYEDFMKSCRDPGAYGQQRPAENIRIACKNIQTAWQPVEAGSTTLLESRNISSELFSDKYHVALQDFGVTIPELNIACPKFREVLETSQIEKSLTCAQILAETRTLKELCVDTIDEAISQNPDLVVVTPTGKTYNSCSTPAQK